MALQKNSMLMSNEGKEMRCFESIQQTIKEELIANWNKHNKIAKRLLQAKYEHKCVITKVDVNPKGIVQKIYKGTTSNGPLIEMTNPDVNFLGDVDVANKNNGDFYTVRIKGLETEYVYYPEVIQVCYKSNAGQLEMTRRGCWLKQDERVKYTKPSDTTDWIYLPGASVWGPSNEKEGSKFFFANTRSNEEWWTKVDELTGGAYKHFFSKKQKSNKILKNTSRLNMYGTTMQKFGEIDLTKYRIVVATCNFDSVLDTERDVAKMLGYYGIDFDVCINDGKNYILATFLADYLNITKEEACMYAVQNRANYIQTKCLGQNLLEHQMEAVLENVIELYGAEQIKIYGNPNGPVAMIADANAAKLINVEALERGDAKIDVYGLAIAKASNSGTSGQLIAKLLEKYFDIAIERLSDLVGESISQMFSDRIQNSRFNPKAGLNNNTAAILGELAVNDEGFMWSTLNEMTTFAKSALADLKISLDSVYNHAMFDDCFVMSRGIVDHILTLKDCGEYGLLVEVFSLDVCVFYADEIEAIENSNMTDEQKEAALDELLSAFIIKYPSAGAEEFLGVRYLTKREWEQRVEASKQKIEAAKTSNLNYLSEIGAYKEIEKAEAKYNKIMKNFEEYCNQIPFGVTLFAGYNFIKNKLAGMDVDFDATLAIFDRIKSILLNKDAKNVLTFIDYKGTSKADYSEVETKKERANLNFGK